MIKKAGLLAYALFAYLLSGISLLYLLGFMADLWVPKAINDGEPISWARALMVNLTLIGLFGLHHSIAARHSFKNKLADWLPPAIERATYLYVTVLLVALLVIYWQPMPLTLWQIDNTIAVAVVRGAFVACFLMMFAATFHFNHFEFFGLRQVWRYVKNSPSLTTAFSSRYLYALVRHPISLGWILLPWLTPHMTLGQLVFALAILVYVLVATPFEEEDLIRELGEDYRRYRRRVPAFWPKIK